MFVDDPTLYIYKNDMMRRHLYQCLVSGKLTPFPRRLKDTMGQQVKGRNDFEVHCYCRMPELKNVGMIECTSCSKRFHLACGDVSTQVLQLYGIVIFVIARLLCIYPANTCGIHALT